MMKFIVFKNSNLIVILSEDDWNSLQETLYLMSPPNNADRLMKSLRSKDFVRFESVEDLKNETGL